MSLADSAPLSTGSGSQGPTLAPPFEPVAVAAASSSSSTTQDEQSSTVAGSSVDEKKQKKRRSLFGFGKKKRQSDAPASSSSTAARQASTSQSTSSAGATPTLSKSTLPPPPPKPDSQTSSQTAGVAPKPPAKDVPSRKPTSPIPTDSFSPMSASITSSGIGGSTTTGSNYGGYYVMPPSSPGRSIAALSSSPRMSSPAGSQIFERDVQESNSVLMPGSPAIPSHITTENYIPPVLDASSEAITDGHLDPDTVEIITHTHHQPAVLAVAGAAGMAGSGGVNSSAASGTFAWVDDVASSFVTDKDDSASNYGSFDTTDIRRLSFISFADVVQAEQQQQHQHQQANAGPGSLEGLASLAALSNGGVNRSSSPMRSPTTDRFGTSPPASKSGSVKNLELSPQRNSNNRPLGSPTRSPKIAAIGTTTGSSLLQMGSGAEISVETMSQALRRTGSGDLSGVRSMPQSPI